MLMQGQSWGIKHSKAKKKKKYSSIINSETNALCIQKNKCHKLW